MIRKASRAFLFLAASLATALPALSQPPTGAEARGLKIPDPQQAVTAGRFLIATIGIDDYSHWPPLENARNDAEGLERFFVDSLGFESPVEPLLDQAATRENILRLLDDQLRAVLRPDDSLILYYAGHGQTRLDSIGGTVKETGFLVPVDASAPGKGERWSDYIRLSQLLQIVGDLPARHVLVILDACHSGYALSLGSETARFRAGSQRYEEDLASRVSRKVITSAFGDQVALDGGPVFGHSLFTGTLIDGMRRHLADADDNNLVTSSELGLFLQQTVAQYSESRQTPDFGAFHNDNRGDMVIRLGLDPFEQAVHITDQALDRGEFERFVREGRRALEYDP